MSNLKIVSDDDEFTSLLKGAGDDLVVIDFYTTWCRPCRSMEPVFESMALHYPKALFLKVDADKCFNTAMNYKVSGVPFFVIYFNKTVVETIQGANPQELELKIRLAEIECRKAATAIEQSNNLAPHVNPVISTFGKLGSVMPYIDQENSLCLNDLSPTSFNNFLGGRKLISGRGTGKILLVYSFTQKMMLQSFKIKANQSNGPKVLRFFVNHPKVLDFNVGSTLAPSQEVTLSLNDLSGERAIELRSGSFQVVTNLQIFVTSSQGKNSRIEIDSLQLFGAPVLAIQPLLAVESMITPPAIVPSSVPSNMATKNNSLPEQSATSQNCNRNPDEDGPFSPSDLFGVQCNVPTTPTHRREDRSNQNHRRASSNGNNEQLPGHSKNMIPAQNQQTDNRDQREKEHHHHKENRRHQSSSSHHRHK